MEALAIACRVALGLTFLVAAVAKARDVAAFTESVRALLPLPGRAAGTAARCVVAVEGAAALGLAVPRSTVLLPAFAAVLALAAGFAVVIAGALRRGVLEPCRCFGAGRRRPLGRVDLGRDVGLGLIAAAGIVAAAHPAHVRLPAAGAAVAGCAGAVAAVLIIFADDLVGLFAPDKEHSWKS